VILAAGAAHSPQILQRSGVGPTSLLAAAGIKQKVDLPGVGANLQDHPNVFIAWHCMCLDSLQGTTAYSKDRSEKCYSKAVDDDAWKSLLRKRHGRVLC